MTAGIETPVGGRRPRLASDLEALFGGPRPDIDRWTSLDADPWHDDRSRPVPEPVELRPLPDDATPAASSAQILPRAARPATDETAPAICDVLAAWRAAERELAGLAQGDPDWNRVHAEFVGLRALHHRLFAARMAREVAAGQAAATRSARFLSLGSPVLTTA